MFIHDVNHPVPFGEGWYINQINQVNTKHAILNCEVVPCSTVLLSPFKKHEDRRGPKLPILEDKGGKTSDRVPLNQSLKDFITLEGVVA